MVTPTPPRVAPTFRPTEVRAGRAVPAVARWPGGIWEGASTFSRGGATNLITNEQRHLSLKLLMMMWRCSGWLLPHPDLERESNAVYGWCDLDATTKNVARPKARTPDLNAPKADVSFSWA